MRRWTGDRPLREKKRSARKARAMTRPSAEMDRPAGVRQGGSQAERRLPGRVAGLSNYQ